MNKKLIRKMQTAAGGPIYSTIEKSDNTRVSYNPIIEMSKRKGLIGTLAGILLLTEHDEAQEKRKLEEANQKRLKRRKELEDKVNAQKKHSLSSSSLINAANDLQYMDTPEGQELAKMNREDEANESAYIASLPWWKKGMFYANKLVNAGFIPVGGGTTGMAAAKTPQQTLSGFISKFGEPGNLERTVNNIILENGHWLPKETGMFAQKHSSVGSSYRKIFEELWGKENTDRLTDDLLGKLILIRNHLIDTNIPLKGDFVYVVDGQAKAYRNGLEIGYLSNSYINNGKALHPEMVKKQGTNNAGVSELLYNGTILAENRPIISGSRLLMPEVTTHIWSKYPTRKLISTEGVHAWPLRTAQERGIKLNYEKNWHTLPEFSKLHQLALDENIRTNLTGLPIYELSEPSYLPMVKNARVFDISLLRDGYINLDFTPGFAYKQGGKMNIIEFLKNGSGIHIKEKNKGKFTSYCGGKVTDECIRKAKVSGNPTLVKRATFALNARRWKHKEGGIIIAGKGMKAGQQAKQNLTKRKAPDWDNLDRGYRYLTQDMKLPHDLAIAIMGNVIEESQGNYKAVLKNGGGRGLIQWDGQPAPTGRYELWGKIWASVAKPANVYDSKTDTMKNYWAPWGGLKGEQVRLKFINAPLKTKTKIYAESYLRPGKPRIKDRQLSAMLLDSIYNPRIKNIIIDKEGGIIKALEGTKTTFGLKILNILGNDTVKTIGSGLFNTFANYNTSSSYNNAIDNRIKALEKYKTYNDNLILDWALLKAEEELKSLFDLQLLAFNSGMSFENPSSIVSEHKKRLLANSYALKAKSLNDMEYLSKVANLESLKLDLTSGIFNGLINTGISAYANRALNPNGTPSKTTITSSNNILKTGYEPYKSGYVDLFGNISTGMGGLQFDKNFNLVLKPLNYFNV